MSESFDPTAIFEWYESIHGQLTPPGGKEGTVIVRERQQTQTVAGVGCTNGQFELHVKSSTKAGMKTRTLTLREYNDLIGRVNRPEYKRIGGVSFRDVLGGESYLVKYIEPSGITYVCLLNPRGFSSEEVTAFVGHLDVILAYGSKSQIMRFVKEVFKSRAAHNHAAEGRAP